MAYKFYEYAKCQSCVKARRWLDKHGVTVDSVPIVELPPSSHELKNWILKSGLESRKFFNSSGVVYKELNLSQKLPSLSLDEQVNLLAANGKLIKRPLLIGEGVILVGFNEDQYLSKLKVK